MIDRSIKSQILAVLDDHISKWYPTLQEALNQPKKLLGILWTPYLKSVKCKIEVNNNSHKLSIAPDIWYYPNISPFLSIQTPSGKWVNFSNLFKVSEKVIEILKSEGFIVSEPSIRSATYELLLIALESKNRNLPSLDEIKRRIKCNLDKFLQRALSNKIKVLSVAPIIGCKIDDTIEFDNGCVLRMPTEFDVFVMVMARGIEEFKTPSMDISISEPVLVAEHEVTTGIKYKKI